MIKYPSVPAPTEKGLLRSVTALYHGYNALTGQPKDTDLTVLNRSTSFDELKAAAGTLPNGALLDGLVYNSDGKLSATAAVPKVVAAFNAEGNGASDPTVSSDFNISSVNRSGVGQYTVYVNESTISGYEILNSCIPCLSLSPGESITGGDLVKNVYLSSTNQGFGAFQLQVYYLATNGQGTNQKIVATNDDLESGEFISCMLFLTGVE